ncbi:glycerophosphodiester phosphodiesterase [Paraglaciecola hydrolytica]|uniref:Glycerophosphodiester phosphodiesterase n=1 Tax=Paraglaciecola hydrolytica TaxID=1799789 RepID=A0A135ZZE6_9ALTE|nr:glycerophosphodiester phosphodiesterase family protein [Paraglaciecola hydrolytica]KXI28358.1 glycerophosphodiester phosphodiesterase [Paraglaciecola hydrolytica]
MLIFAHRGASADAPENTLGAIKLALTQQVDGIEIDVHQVEQELVVIHDRWVHRTTNGTGQLPHYSMNQLRTLDAGQGEKVPTLWEVMQLIAGQCMLNIEVKGLKDVALVITLINKAQAELGFKQEQFIVSSFDHHLLAQIKQLSPTLKIGALTASKPIDYALFAATLGAYSVNADITFLDQAFVDDAHQRGLQVMVYTVDEAEDLEMLYHWGVDGVFCNSPAKAKMFINSIRSGC